MKYITLSVLFLLVIFVFCIFSAFYVSNTIDHAVDYLNMATVCYHRQEIDQAVRYLENAMEFWEDRQCYFGMVLKHEEVDEVTNELTRLQSYAQSDDRDDFLSNCAALQATLAHIREMEWPVLQNIL